MKNDNHNHPTHFRATVAKSLIIALLILVIYLQITGATTQL